MQTFRATATVNEDNELCISHLPFPPGAELEIIVLDKRTQSAEGGKKDSSLAQDQYRLAKQYPGEFVVLVETISGS